jgi:Leucine-rich repeat (LRR) protein
MNLHDLAPSISGLVKLRELYLGETKVEKLLEDIGQFESLEMLKLARCKQLKTLPKSIGCLEQLEHLDVSENPSHQMLPESFGCLEVLNHLNIGGCSFGEAIGLPSNVGDLTNLKSLSLDGNLMNTIPESLKTLSALQWQDLPMLELPRNLNLFNLVELNLGPSKILKCLWQCDLHTQV